MNIYWRKSDNKIMFGEDPIAKLENDDAEFKVTWAAKATQCKINKAEIEKTFAEETSDATEWEAPRSL